MTFKQPMYAVTLCETIGHGGYADVLHIDGGPFLIEGVNNLRALFFEKLGLYGPCCFTVQSMSKGSVITFRGKDQSWDDRGVIEDSDCKSWIAIVSNDDFVELDPLSPEFSDILENL